MARSQLFMDGWRHAERSLTKWLYNRAECMGDPRALSILYSAADDFGKWSKGRFSVNDRNEAANPEDPLAVFRAAVRRDALEEAAKIAESLNGFGAYGTNGVWQPNPLAAAIRAAKRICVSAAYAP
jgi:hypothetical protein